MNLIQWFTDPANWSGPNGIPVRTAEQFAIAGIAMLIAIAIALPVGIILGHLRRGGFVAVNIGNIGRAVPTLGLLVILASIPAIGVGNEAAVLALAAFGIPPILVNTYVGLSEVDPALRDAAQGMGLTGGQVLRKVEVPMALPMIAAGLRTSTVQVMATASLAALVGSGGLGRYVVDGFATQDNTLILAGAILTAAASIVADGLLALVERAMTPKGLKLEHEPEITALDEASIPESDLVHQGVA